MPNYFVTFKGKFLESYSIWTYYQLSNEIELTLAGWLKYIAPKFNDI